MALSVRDWIFLGVMALAFTIALCYAVKAMAFNVGDWIFTGVVALAFIIAILTRGPRLARWISGRSYGGTILWPLDACLAAFAQATKAVMYPWPHSRNAVRRRDLVTRFPIRHKYPSVLQQANNDLVEQGLSNYAHCLNLKININHTNATLFRIRSWLRECEIKHYNTGMSTQCHPLNDGSQGTPLWLVDIEQCCVVPYKSSMRYIALSYVWGDVKSAQFETTNHKELQQPYSLLGRRAVLQIPATIKDAMFLTGLLGCRYLWCDRLCIVQDDLTARLQQIRQMADIYARSYCTIIAFDSTSADSGLHGIPNLSSRCGRDKIDSHHGPKADWANRAWTLQEELFSVRQIWLSQGEVSWQCPFMGEAGSTLCEIGALELHRRRHLSLAVGDRSCASQVGGLLCPKDASLTFYVALVEVYSRTYVSDEHPEDRVLAYASIESVLEQVYPGGFVQSLAVSLFAACLLWEPDTRHATSWRHSHIKDPLTGRKVPSWSWMGWCVPVVFPRQELSFRKQFSGTTHGHVSWYVSQHVTSQRFLVIVAESEAWIDHERWEGDYPSTSRRIQPRPDQRSVSAKDGLNVVDDPSPTRVQPPLSQPLEQLQPDERSRCNYLHGRVLLAKFCSRNQNPGLNCRTFLYSLQTEQYAGILVDDPGDISNGSLLHLIAISSGTMTITSKPFNSTYRSSLFLPGPPKEYYFAPTPRNSARTGSELSSLELDKEYAAGDTYEFYDALWVEWKDGVAYRKGLARIAKAVWERDVVGWIDITLG